MFVVPCKLCGKMPTERAVQQGDCEGLYTAFIVECHSHSDMIVRAAAYGPYTSGAPSMRHATNDQSRAAAWHAWNNAHKASMRWLRGSVYYDTPTPERWLTLYTTH
jgi:hypothetical protein